MCGDDGKCLFELFTPIACCAATDQQSPTSPQKTCPHILIGKKFGLGPHSPQQHRAIPHIFFPTIPHRDVKWTS